MFNEVTVVSVERISEQEYKLETATMKKRINTNAPLFKILKAIGVVVVCVAAVSMVVCADMIKHAIW